MDISVRQVNGVSVLSLSGRLDAVSAPEFDSKTEALLQEGANQMLLSFSGLEYISSAGLRSILALAKKLNNKGGSIILCELRDTVKEIFEISGFYSVFKIHETEADALAG